LIFLRQVGKKNLSWAVEMAWQNQWCKD